MAVFGTSVTYKPGDGDSTTITAALGDEGVNEFDEGEGTEDRRMVRIATIQTDATEATYSGISTPRIDDVIEIGSVEWRVMSIGKKLGGLVALTIEKRPAHRVGRPGFRR